MERVSIKNPLVSIVVITYNSSRYVLETLESAKAQTYSDIELIVTDDCSTDNTVEICKKWINENSDRFLRTELVISHTNTGISANCNRGINAVQGEWIKYIAGDDLLLPNCINENVNYVKEKKEVNFVFSDAYRISKNGIIIRKIGPNEKIMNLNIKGQFRNILKEMFVPPMCSFIRKDTLISLGGFNEETPFIEDHSLFINALRNGNKFYYLPVITVSYRKHDDSITSGIVNKKLAYYQSMQFAKSIVEFYDDNYFNDVLRFKMYRIYFHATLRKKKFQSIIKENNFIALIINSLNYIDPVFMIHKIKISTKRVLKRILLYFIYRTLIGDYLIKNKIKLPASLRPV